MRYKIVKDFFKPEHFNILKSLDLKPTNKDQLSIYHNKVTKNGKIYSECINKNILAELDKVYRKKMLEILFELYPEKVKYFDYSEFHIIETGSHYSYPIHNDNPEKLLSGVIYLAPFENKGTIIYDDKNGKNPKEITWKPNLGFFFSRKENETWHSYEGDKKNNRVALVYNLMTDDIKQICKIEKINYIEFKIKSFLNPYIYRFFKKLL